MHPPIMTDASATLPIAILAPGRDHTVRRGHPWIFSGAVKAMQDAEGVPSGSPVRVRGADGTALGVAAWSPASQIALRLWTRDADRPIDEALFLDALDRAIAWRSALGLDPLGATDPGSALRLLHGEADGLPGVVCDRYGKVLVLQLTAAGAEWARAMLVAALAERFPDCTIYERSDVDIRRKEGLEPRVGLLRGAMPDGPVAFREGGVEWLADVVSGHKTGFYLDQAPNRARLAGLARGASVLNVFSYTGGFGIACAKAGAMEVTHVDSSAPALTMMERIAALNGLEPPQAQALEGNAFEVLRTLRDKAKQYDLVILDPPKLAANAAQVDKASRAYKDLILWGLKLTKAGGHLAAFSCSGNVDIGTFRRIAADAAADAGRDAVMLETLAAGADHPAPLAFPEGEYLKGVLLGVR